MKISKELDFAAKKWYKYCHKHRKAKGQVAVLLHLKMEEYRKLTFHEAKVDAEMQRILLNYHLVKNLIELHGVTKAQEELRKIVKDAGMM